MAYKVTMLAAVLALLAGLSACRGGADLTCDELRPYQLAVEGTRVESPDDLDDLDTLREMPLPDVSPRPPRPEGSPCIDLPPSVLSGS